MVVVVVAVERLIAFEVTILSIFTQLPSVNVSVGRELISDTFAYMGRDSAPAE